MITIYCRLQRTKAIELYLTDQITTVTCSMNSYRVAFKIINIVNCENQENYWLRSVPFKILERVHVYLTDFIIIYMTPLKEI
jgi:hypothetical protein